jgi:hypothetical protein
MAVLPEVLSHHKKGKKRWYYAMVKELDLSNALTTYLSM